MKGDGTLHEKFGSKFVDYGVKIIQGNYEVLLGRLSNFCRNKLFGRKVEYIVRVEVFFSCDFHLERILRNVIILRKM